MEPESPILITPNSLFGYEVISGEVVHPMAYIFNPKIDEAVYEVDEDVSIGDQLPYDSAIGSKSVNINMQLIYTSSKYFNLY